MESETVTETENITGTLEISASEVKYIPQTIDDRILEGRLGGGNLGVVIYIFHM